MRAMVANGFGGYQDLKLTEIPKPTVSDGRVLVRVTAAGVTPLDNTILSGHFPMSQAPLVLGNEGAGIVEAGGDQQYPNGSRVMREAEQRDVVAFVQSLKKEIVE